MPENQTSSKPSSLEQPIGEGLSSSALFGWIPKSDREPTAEDCDISGFIWMWMPEYEEVGAQYGKLDAIHKATHWQPINLKCHKIPTTPIPLPNV